MSLHFGSVDGAPAAFVNNALLDPHRAEGLFLHLDRVIDLAQPAPLRVLSTSKAFAAAPVLRSIQAENWQEKSPIGALLTDWAGGTRSAGGGARASDAGACHLAQSGVGRGPLSHADRVRPPYRTIQREPAYHGINVLFLSGLNVGVSPRDGLMFPLTKFVPWTAYARLRNGTTFLLECRAIRRAKGTASRDRSDIVRRSHRNNGGDRGR
jgi:hypothetical protein